MEEMIIIDCPDGIGINDESNGTKGNKKEKEKRNDELEGQQNQNSLIRLEEREKEENGNEKEENGNEMEKVKN